MHLAWGVILNDSRVGLEIETSFEFIGKKKATEPIPRIIQLPSREVKTSERVSWQPGNKL